MARCSPLSDVGVANLAEAENLDVVDHPVGVAQTIDASEVLGASDGEGPTVSAGGTDDSDDGGASDNKNSQTYYFGSSTITRVKIKEMVEKGHFVEGEAEEPRAEKVP
jgi:hypothetical protein